MQNRSKANRILIIVFIMFVLTTILKFYLRNSFTAGLLSFVFEAALVGGIADWFAVTALFKKPLGFSWHTAIIPNNRDRIIEKVSVMVSDELLSVESIKNRLGGLNLVNALVDRLSGSVDKAVLENQVASFVSGKVDSLDKTGISRDIDGLIKDNLKKEGVSNEIRNMLQNSIDEGKHREWLAGLLGKALEIARKPTTRERIYRILKEQERYNEGKNSGAGSFFVKTILNISRNSKHTNLFNISEVLQKELIEVLVQIGSPGHPIFQKILEKFADTVNNLDNDDVLIQAIQKWKNGILDRVDLLENLQYLVSSIIESQMYRDEAVGWIAEHLDNYWEELKHNNETQAWMDDTLKIMLEKIIRNEHHVIAEIATETLEAFTNERLNQFIEDKVGNDLQWIRINGSIVGAAAGLVIYLFTNLFYSPVVVPMIQALLGIG